VIDSLLGLQAQGNRHIYKKFDLNVSERKDSGNEFGENLYRTPIYTYYT
ncbi:uncharacterized protein METZ01_LOCUS498888, partial [marine metagenome]